MALRKLKTPILPIRSTSVLVITNTRAIVRAIYATIDETTICIIKQIPVIPIIIGISQILALYLLKKDFNSFSLSAYNIPNGNMITETYQYLSKPIEYTIMIYTKVYRNIFATRLTQKVSFFVYKDSI